LKGSIFKSTHCTKELIKVSGTVGTSENFTWDLF